MQIIHRISKIEVTALLAVVIIATYTYFNVGNHTFLFWDDMENIVKNQHFNKINLTNLNWIFTSLDQVMWIPVTSLSHMLLIAIFGKNALPFIVVNIIIHICNSLLVYFIAKETISKLINCKIISKISPSSIYYIAFFSSITFAVNPMHVESVAWITERKDVLCGLFYFSAILAYMKYLNDKSKYYFWYITLLCFIFAIASKSMAVTLPLVLSFIDIVIADSQYFKSILPSLFSSIRKLSVMYVTAAVFTIITIVTQRAEIHNLAQIGLIERVANITESLIHYLGGLIIPIDLSPFYPMSDYNNYTPSMFFVTTAALCLSSYIVVRLYQHNKKVPALILIYFIITITPVLGLVKIGFAAYADRYTYIPSLSLHIGAGYLLVRFAKSGNNNMLWIGKSILVVLYVVSLIYSSKNYVDVWKNDDTLWSKVNNKFAYKSDLAYVNYGNVLYRNTNYKQAVYNYRIALAINPNLIEAIKNLADYNENIGNKILASYYYTELAERNPMSANAHVVSGDYFYNTRDMRKAEYHYRTALKLSPGNEDIIFKVAVMDYITLHKEDAKIKIDSILSLNPDHLGALQLKTKIEFDSKNVLQARKYALRVLKLNPMDRFANFVLNSQKK